MTDLYNYVNPKNGKHSPLISKETHEIIMRNADVSEGSNFPINLGVTLFFDLIYFDLTCSSNFLIFLF